MNPRFPVYIVSKGRWKRNPTRKSLDAMGVDYWMIVEEQEVDLYAKHTDPDRILVLPKEYQEDYDTFWDDDDDRTGPGPARNFAWDHSMGLGQEWHWVMDDNIESFKRFNNNMKVKVTSGTILYVAEDFVLRYENIGQAGLNYEIFCPAREGRPPFKLNTRIYSCILIRNDIPFRWRGRYNEDTDLSLRILKSGLCTVQFNAFLQEKRSTTSLKGGNTAEFYENEGTENKTKMLQDMHPDVARVTERFGRPHHWVDYSKFEVNQLIFKDGVQIQEGVNDYGMKLIKTKGSK